MRREALTFPSPREAAGRALKTFVIYAGALKGPAGRAALQWATSNQQAIKVEWNRINPRFPVQ
jgi:hypothetical protein